MTNDTDLALRLAVLTAHAPAAGAMVLRRGRIVASAVRGRRIAARPDQVTIHDPWHVGSCTKAMTATLIARLQAHGSVDIGVALGDVLPGMAMHPAFAAMPLREVLRHEAGIRRDPHWSVFARLRATRATLLEQRRHLAALALRERPLPGAGYSNLGYIVLGAVIEAVTGRTWEDAIRHEVFDPLGMRSAGFGAPPLPAPVGHVMQGRRWRARPPGPWADNPPVHGPAGRVHLPLVDWARFAAVHLAAGPPGYLPVHLLRIAHIPGRAGYAAGWGASLRPDGTTLLRHTGSNTMWFADIRLVPRTGIGIAIVCNAFSSDVRNRVGLLADALLAEAEGREGERSTPR